MEETRTRNWGQFSGGLGSVLDICIPWDKWDALDDIMPLVLRDLRWDAWDMGYFFKRKV